MLENSAFRRSRRTERHCRRSAAQLRYAALGLELRLKEDTGLFAVSAEEGKPTVGIGTFPGETEESIAIGATLNEVRDRYGEPTRSRGPSDSPFALIYSDKGVAFVLADKRVTAMMVNRPGDH